MRRKSCVAPSFHLLWVLDKHGWIYMCGIISTNSVCHELCSLFYKFLNNALWHHCSHSLDSENSQFFSYLFIFTGKSNNSLWISITEVIIIDFPSLITCMFKPAFTLSNILSIFYLSLSLVFPIHCVNNFSVSVYSKCKCQITFCFSTKWDFIAHFVSLPVSFLWKKSQEWVTRVVTKAILMGTESKLALGLFRIFAEKKKHIHNLPLAFSLLLWWVRTNQIKVWSLVCFFFFLHF